MKVRGISFSNKYTRGSCADRVKRMEEIRSAVFENVMGAFDPNPYNPAEKGNFIPIKSIRKLIREVLPEPLMFDVRKLPVIKDNKYGGYIFRKIEDDSVRYYQMRLPAENNQLSVRKVPTLLHETTHLLEYAINPQYNNVLVRIHQRGLDKKVNNLYESTFYTLKKESKHKVKKRTKDTLKDMTVEDQLLVLKTLQLDMETEIRGYAATKYYTSKQPCVYGKKWRFNSKDYKKAQFERNLELVKEMRKKIIESERKKIKQNLRTNA